jgi:hypothetical protein
LTISGGCGFLDGSFRMSHNRDKHGVLVLS